MKTDFYTKAILTVIALCLVFNIVKDLEIIPSAKADDSVSADLPLNSLLNSPTLRTNSDGSINVRLATADVIEVKPAYGATFDVRYSSPLRVEPASTHTTFKVDPQISSSTVYKVEPVSGARFTVEPYYNSTFAVKPASTSTSFKVEPATSYTKFGVEPASSSTKFYIAPANNAVFPVRETGNTSYSAPGAIVLDTAYPNPTIDFLTINYNTTIANEQLTVYNMNGQPIESVILDPNNNQLQLNVSHYPTGTYIYGYGGYSGKFLKK